MVEKQVEQKKEVSTGLIVFATIGIVLLFLIVVTTTWVIGSYNTFVIANQDVDNQFSNIATEYQRRADLFYNLAEATSSYKTFEQDTFVNLANARSGNFGETREAQIQNMNSLDSLFSKLMVVVEAYPELKASEQYQTLMQEIRITENRIQIARTDYNSLVRSYNILISRFPKSILANHYGYKQKLFFENQVSTNQAPKIEV